MKKFIFGLVLGLILGAVAVSWAARIVGGNGYLIGWSVTLDGDEICSDPFIWVSIKEIECN